MGRADRSRDRAASNSLRVAALVRRGHGRRPAHAATKLAPAAGFGPRPSARRVIVKAHLQKLGTRGAQASARHLRYIERDGVEKDGSPGVLYGPEGPASRERFGQPRLGERHQFQFIISPEDARDLDLTDYVRELMTRVERDLGRPIEWAAVNHFDTEHPHAHVVIRGVCREGRPLRIERAYIAQGLRWTAQELATERLGPRLAMEIRRTYEREVTQQRFTSLDREIEHAAKDGRVDTESLIERRHGPERALLVHRLAQLERLGLVEKVAPSGWVLAEGWREQLRELGERGDILKQVHRALHGGDAEHFHVVGRGHGLPDGKGGVEERTVVGWVVGKGLGDELKGRAFYAVIETPTGDIFHVTASDRLVDALRAGDLVSFGTKREPAVQPVDRHLAEVAAAHGGVYERARDSQRPDLDRTAPRRLRELERHGLITSPGPGQWRVPPDLLKRLETRDGEARARYRLSVQALPLSLDAQVRRQGPVWLDTVDPSSLATTGFGAEVRAAVERRLEALGALGIAPDDSQRTAKIRDLEYRAVGRELERRTGQRFVEDAPARFGGRLAEVPDGSRYLAVTDGARFVLIAGTREARSRTGQLVEAARDASGRPVLAEELAARLELSRRTAGEALARETRMTFLERVPAGFKGRVREGLPESPYLVVADGARFVLVPTTPEARALLGRTVHVARATPVDAPSAFATEASTEGADGRPCPTPLQRPSLPHGACGMTNPLPSSLTVPKVRRVRIYTRLSHGLRTRLLAYCAATGRSERAVIEDAVERYLAHPSKDVASAAGPLERLAQAIDGEQQLRERNERKGTDRQSDKDALDVLRLLRGTSTDDLAGRYGMPLVDERSKAPAESAILLAREQFGRKSGLGVEMAVRSAGPLADAAEIGASCEALANDVFRALSR